MRRFGRGAAAIHARCGKLCPGQCVHRAHRATLCPSLCSRAAFCCAFDASRMVRVPWPHKPALLRDLGGGDAARGLAGGLLEPRWRRGTATPEPRRKGRGAAGVRVHGPPAFPGAARDAARSVARREGRRPRPRVTGRRAQARGVARPVDHVHRERRPERAARTDPKLCRLRRMPHGASRRIRPAI